ncbi:hypothetical protein ACXIVK_37785 [Paraburkholderia caledonica]
MRFKRYGRYEFTDTPRKRAAFARKQRLEREALPLFADQIAAEQIGADEEMEGRRAQWDRQTASDRLRRATQWRRARGRLRGYLAPVRSALHAYWQQCRWPADPEYLLTMLHMYDTGRLSLPDTSTST